MALQSRALGEEAKPDKPKVAFFPFAGEATEDFRDKVGFSLRTKLDRTGKYEVIDGYTMKDAVAGGGPITMATDEKTVREMGQALDASVLIWGEVTGVADGGAVKLKLLDLREGDDAKSREVDYQFDEPTDLRFVAEKIVEALPGVDKHIYITDVAVVNDPKAEALWKTGPNLAPFGDFAKSGPWEWMYLQTKAPAPISDAPPEVDTVVIYRMPDPEARGGRNNVLAMNLSRWCAENPGMACISKEIKIEPNTRYRISFRYKSDAPVIRPFIKGYTPGKDIKGKPTLREVYRRQVPLRAATGGEWVEVVDELNPQHVTFPVTHLKIDLYAYLNPGVVMWDDVVLKAVGEQTRHAKDPAIMPPTTRERATK